MAEDSWSSSSSSVESSSSSSRLEGDAFHCEWNGCGFSTKKKTRLSNHLRKHTGERPYACDRCSKTFIRSDHLARHVSIHDVDDASSSDCDDGLSRQAQAYAERPLACTFEGCAARFRLPDHLKRHVKKLHMAPEKCTWPDCPLSFSRHTLLLRHMASHVGQKPFACSKPGCNQSFDQPSLLQRHIARHHEAVHRCTEPDCNQEFSRFCDLTQHRRDEHLAPTPDCEVCGQSFTTKNKRRLHMRCHTEARVQCTFEGCSKTYSNQSNMQTHFRAVHQQLRDHPCLVDGCSSAFSTPSALKRHQNSVHSGETNKRPRDQQEQLLPAAALVSSTPIQPFEALPRLKIQRAC